MKSPLKILMVEDSQDYQTLISETLSHYEIRQAVSAEEALAELNHSRYDLILLDIGLPGKNGFTLLSELQSQSSTSSIPVICITGRSEINDKVTAFNLGADDYLPKPFSLLELKARVDAKLLKSSKLRDSSRVIGIGNLKIDLNSHIVTISLDSGSVEEVNLTQTEFKLLSLFSKNPSTLYSRDRILAAVWGNQVRVSDRVIDVHLCSLRKKIKNSNLKITPIAGEGYKLTVERALFAPASELQSIT